MLLRVQLYFFKTIIIIVSIAIYVLYKYKSLVVKYGFDGLEVSVLVPFIFLFLKSMMALRTVKSLIFDRIILFSRSVCFISRKSLNWTLHTLFSCSWFDGNFSFLCFSSGFQFITKTQIIRY